MTTWEIRKYDGSRDYFMGYFHLWGPAPHDSSLQIRYMVGTMAECRREKKYREELQVKLERNL